MKLFRYILNVLFVVSALQINASSFNGFIENRGQIKDQHGSINHEVLYILPGKSANLQLKSNGYSYELFDMSGTVRNENNNKTRHQPFLATTVSSQRVDLEFLNINPEVRIIADEKQSFTFNYVTGETPLYEVPVYRKITYKNIYPLIDLVFTFNENSEQPAKYDLILHPGAKMTDIKWKCSGAQADIKNSQLNLSVTGHLITEKIPASFYADEPNKYIQVKQSCNENIIGFEADYDHTKKLIIDPSSNLIWSTYFGGNMIENCSATGLDGQNNVFITGQTLSTSNIATAGVYQSTYAGNYDAYLAKFTSNGNLIWCTYFGGSGYETSYALLVLPDGTTYFSGNTSSTVNVASPGAHQTVYGGGIDDALLAKFNSSGQRLWSTYYGGNQHDIAYCLTFDGSQNPIIAGHTESANTGNCIASPGAFNTAFSFGFDAFIAKFNSSGVRQWGTYYGDTGLEEAWGVACDAGNNVYITGFTNSLSNIATFPCHQPFNNGGSDGFLAKFDPSGSNLIWGTYYGGTGDDQGAVVEIKGNNVFVSGNTSSNSDIATAGAYQTVMGSADDVFFACFDLSGTRQWGSYFGGNGSDYVYDMLIDGNGNFIFCGQTLSSNSISIPSAFQPSIGLANTYDGYFAKFKPNGKLILSSYFGSSGGDYGRGIALENSNNILYFCGETTSTVGIATGGVHMSNPGGSQDGFLARFCLAPKPQILPALTPTLCVNDFYVLTGSPGYNSYFWSTGAITNSITVGGAWLPGTYNYTLTVTDQYGCNGTSDTAKIVVNNCITGIEKNQGNAKDELVYPNPCTKEFYFVSYKEQVAYLYNSAGMLVRTIRMEKNTNRLNVADLSQGLYFLRWQEENSARTEKLIIQAGN